MAENNNAAPAAGAVEPTQADLAKIWEQESAIRADPNAAPPPEVVETSPEEPEKVELPPELQAALSSVDSLKTLVGQLQHQVRSSEGRVGAIQQELQQARQAAAAVNRAPNEQAVRAAAKIPEKWAKLKNEFPEWGEAVESLVDTYRSEAAPQVDLTAMQAEIQGKIDATLSKFHWAIEEAKLFGAYRNYRQIINTPEYDAWLNIQSPELKAKMASKDSSDAIELLDLYSDHRRKTTDATRNVNQERGSRLAAAAVPAKKVAAPPPKDDRELTAAEIWAAESDARLEKRRTRF